MQPRYCRSRMGKQTRLQRSQAGSPGSVCWYIFDPTEYLGYRSHLGKDATCCGSLLPFLQRRLSATLPMKRSLESRQSLSTRKMLRCSDIAQAWAARIRIGPPIHHQRKELRALTAI